MGYSEKLTDMSARMKSVLAVNGDSYSNNRHVNNGTIIRNGVIYRNKQTTEETCVLNWDGTMDIYQPGHYCLLLVDGRQKSSRGMFLDEMAKVFEDLGCKAAYNLDGGHCSFMTMKEQVVNHPYKPEHEVEDGIFITEGLS